MTSRGLNGFLKRLLLAVLNSIGEAVLLWGSTGPEHYWLFGASNTIKIYALR